MKIRNPEDEKYFKDITLNSILQEISQENEKNEDFNKALQSEINNKSQTKFYLQIIFYAIMTILLLLFFFIPLNQPKSTVNTSKAPSTKATQKKTIDTIQTKEKLPEKIKLPEVIKMVSKKKKPTTESIRDTAKEALLKQMKEK